MNSSYNRESMSAVSGNSSSYASLSTYNSGSTAMAIPVPAGTVSGSYIVPAYGSIGYNALTHGGNAGSGYNTIGPAYRSDGGDCNQQYVRKLCQ
jgi:hypothetical protein